MVRPLRVLLVLETATFVTAALIHFGNLVEGYRHQAAGTGESLIAVVLLAGLSLSGTRWPLQAVIAAQAFATLGVLVGLMTIAIGVGPRTVPDIAYHVGILITLIGGLAIAVRTLSARESP
jgi:hypothetical protein